MAKKKAVKGRKLAQNQTDVPASPKPQPTPLAEEGSTDTPGHLASEETPAHSKADEPSHPSATMAASPEADPAARGPTPELSTHGTDRPDMAEHAETEEPGLVNGSSTKEEDPTTSVVPVTDINPESPLDQDSTDIEEGAAANAVEDDQSQAKEVETEVAPETQGQQVQSDDKAIGVDEPTEHHTAAEPPAEFEESTEPTKPTESAHAPTDTPVDVTAGKSELHEEHPSAPEVPAVAAGEGSEATEPPAAAAEPPAAPEPEAAEPDPTREQRGEEAIMETMPANDESATSPDPSGAEPEAAEQPTVSDSTPQVPEAAVEPGAEDSAEQQQVEDDVVDEVEAPEAPEVPEAPEPPSATAAPATLRPAVEGETIPEPAIEQEPQIATATEPEANPASEGDEAALGLGVAAARALTPPLPQLAREDDARRPSAPDAPSPPAAPAPGGLHAAASLSEARVDRCHQSSLPQSPQEEQRDQLRDQIPDAPRSIAPLAAQRLARFQPLQSGSGSGSGGGGGGGGGSSVGGDAAVAAALAVPAAPTPPAPVAPAVAPPAPAAAPAPASDPAFTPASTPASIPVAPAPAARPAPPPAPPKSEAVRQLFENSRPPAPSPPAGRVRPRHRHVPTFFSDDDESDSALLQPRRGGRALHGGGEGLASSRDSSGSRYPPQSAPAHSRPAFASRVPIEHYSNSPPPPPPGYHPGYGYPPAAPPYYHPHHAHGHAGHAGHATHAHGHAYSLSQHSFGSPSPYRPRPLVAPSSPYQDPWNQYPPGYPPHASLHQRHDSSASRDHSSGIPSLENASLTDGDTADVFSRLQHISQAIPDLHVLLARYKETHGQLSVREELLRRSGVEQEKKLSAKDDEIHDLNDRIRHLESRQSAEGNRLRFEIRSLEEQVNELREQVFRAEKAKRVAEDATASLKDAMTSWEVKYKELEQSYAALEREAAEEREQAWRDFDEWKSTATTRHDAEKIALAIQFDKKLKEADVLADSHRQEAAAAFDEEREELRAELQRQQEDYEDQVRAEFETKLSAVHREHEEALQAERDNLQREWDEERELIEAQHLKDKEDLQADANRQAEEHKARADRLSREKEELLTQYEALKAESQKEKEIIKSVATNLDSEKARLEKMMECYGDIAEIKSKGDDYYLASFTQLQKLIIDLASTHFVHLPVRPPADDLSHVPSNLPSFLGDSAASRQVRAAYVAHTVSKLITYRVFGPFLFSLGRRYDKADGLFLSMSHHIREKSTRKEAIWRQQTLLAAFTSSGAKQRINTAAGTVVEEIVNAIKNFADPKEEEGIKVTVKRIVKLAAETWRFARLEREMITAVMPALQDEEHQFNGKEFWTEHDFAYSPTGTLIGTPTGGTPPFEPQPRLLLRLFPVIYREAKHENFHSNDEQNDQGCIYHNGMALYDNAESVQTRAEELKSAGLPSFTTTSPTRAEFGKYPPPVVPPPRSSLPPTPAMSEMTASIRTRSPPASPTDGDMTPVRKRTPPPNVSVSSIAALHEPDPKMARPVRAYHRLAPSPVDFAVTPRNFIGMPMPVESIFGPQSNHNSPATLYVDPTSHRSILPDERHPARIEEEPADLQPTSVGEPELGTPPSFPEQRNPPTPPYSRSSTPPRPGSPLFEEATDELDALTTHRPPPLLRRRSTRTRRSSDEGDDVRPESVRPESVRRSSAYSLSARTIKSDKSLDLKSRYLHESRASAALRGLYPNYHSRPREVRDAREGYRIAKEKREREKEREARRESLELQQLRRERADDVSVADNGTWDTNSTLSSLETNTQFSVN